MPSRVTDVELTASEAGVISFSDQVSLPITVKITKVFFETTDNCMGRTHQSLIQVDGVDLLQFQSEDCKLFSQDVQLKLSRGAHSVQVQQDGYAPGEQVKGKVGIEFQISLF